MKRFFSALLALAMLLQPFAAQAVDLDEAFSDLVGPGTTMTASGPGRFSSSSRTGVTLGSFEMRVPRSSTPVLLNASAPKIDAGCNGISAHFGGFSFISGTEFTNLIKQIASGAAMGFVTSLVMKSLCPMCEAVVQELKSAAQAAARLSKDSCAIGEQFGRDLLSSSSPYGSGLNTCAKITASAGTSNDWLESSASSLCDTIQNATKTLNEWAQTPSGPEGAAPGLKGAQCLSGGGNETWRNLSAFDSASGTSTDSKRKLMLINLMGAYMNTGGEDIKVSCAGPDGTPRELKPNETAMFCPPMTDVKTLVSLYMCGAPGANLGETSAAVKDYCGKLIPKNASGVKLWTCDNEETCNNLVAENASELVVGTGLLVNISELLRDAVQRVRDGDTGFTDAQGKRILALVDAAPFPLYQAINAAAVYPVATEGIIDSMTVAIAEQFAHAILDETLRVAGRAGSGACINREQANNILTFLANLRNEHKQNMDLIGQNLIIQKAISEQIRAINTAISREVLTEDMLASGQVTQAINRALSPSGATLQTPPGAGD